MGMTPKHERKINILISPVTISMPQRVPFASPRSARRVPLQAAVASDDSKARTKKIHILISPVTISMPQRVPFTSPRLGVAAVTKKDYSVAKALLLPLLRSAPPRVKKDGVFAVPGLCRVKTRVKPAAKTSIREMFGKVAIVKAKPDHQGIPSRSLDGCHLTCAQVACRSEAHCTSVVAAAVLWCALYSTSQDISRIT